MFKNFFYFAFLDFLKIVF